MKPTSPLIYGLLLAISFTPTAKAQTNVSGYILSNTTWTLASSPYIVTGNILVNNGVTLTIEPGVTVKFDTTKTLQIDGELIAAGTAQSRITFTASDPTPVVGSWGRIQFSPNSTDAVLDTAGNYVSGSILKYCDIRYGGGVPGDVTVYCDTAAPYFSHCRVSDCLMDGISIVNATGRVDSSSFRGFNGKALSISYADSINFIMRNDTFENNINGIACNGPGTTTIQDCIFITSGALSVSGGIHTIIQRCFFTNSSGTALSAGGDNNVTIQDCNFSNSGTAANAWSNSSSTSIVIKGCTFTNSATAINVSTDGSTLIDNNGFTANANAITGNLGLNATISNNIFTGQTNSVVGGHVCFSFEGDPYPGATLRASNLTISNNHFENNVGAIFVTTRSIPLWISYPSFTVIQGNTFLNNQFILTNNCPETWPTPEPLVYTYVLVKLFAGHGIMTNNVFDGNTSPSGKGDFISVQGGWKIDNNTIKNNAPGKVSTSGTTNICTNKFLNNSGSIIITTSAYSSDTVSIHDNEFSNNNSGTGSTISAAKVFSINDNDFLNNTTNGKILSLTDVSIVNNNELQGNSSASGLISISGSLITTFSNNRLINNLDSANNPIVSVSSNSNIHNNDFQGNTGRTCLLMSNINQQGITQNNFVNPNVQYEIESQIPFGPGANISATNNYWGGASTAHIDSVIKDYFDDANLSVVLYPPVLSSPAVADTSASCTSSIACSLSVSGMVTNVSCYGGSNGAVNITVTGGATPYRYFWSSGTTLDDINSRTSGTYTVTVIDGNLCSATKSFVVSQPAAPVSVVSGVVTNANCNTGGSINISAGGGTSPYTYNWGSGITMQNRSNLNPGNYSVTVRDNYNCSVTQSFTVGQDGGPVISGAATNTSCNNTCDGAINLSITGVAPFTYDWGNGFGTSEDTSGLCAGTYNVTVADSNNCGIAATFTIASPVVLNATANVTIAVSCFGFSDGAATAVASGGTPPYSFFWSTGQTTPTFNGLSAGTYGITVTDAPGCTTSASVTLSDGLNVFVGAIGGPSNAAINQSTTYIVSANPNYSYTWSVLNGIILSGHGTNSIEVAWTAAGAGSIQLIAQEQGCADTVSKSVTVIDTTINCSAQFYLYPDTVPHSYFIVNTASGIPQLSYSWSWGDGSTDTVPYPSHTYSSPGFYSICLSITDSVGCTDTYCNPYFLLKTEGELSAMITVNVVSPLFTGILAPALNNIEIAPNPTAGTITLKTESIHGQAMLKLFDTVGKLLHQQSIEGNELASGLTIDLAPLNNGLYFLHFHTATGNQVVKVMKQ